MLRKFLTLIRSRKGLFVLAAIFCALLIGALLIGVSDNIPGIVLCYLAATIPFIALTRNWQSVKKFLKLMGASAVGLIVFAVLHNLVYALFIYFFGEDFWIRVGLEDEPFFFIMAIIVCPAAFLVGAVGSVVLAIKKFRRAR
jgi:hypothetical protein